MPYSLARPAVLVNWHELVCAVSGLRVFHVYKRDPLKGLDAGQRRMDDRLRCDTGSPPLPVAPLDREGFVAVKPGPDTRCRYRHSL